MAAPHPLLAALPAVERRVGGLPRGADWEALIAQSRPVLFAGAADDWPLVQAGRRGAGDAAALLRAGWSGEPVLTYRLPAEAGGRVYYNAAFDGFNFATAREDLGAVLDELLAGAEGGIYLGSVDLPRFFPQLGGAAGLDLAAIHPMLTAHAGLASLWIGNRTTASCHYDFSHNIAVCAVGQRRFTLFPPDQISHLYPGPLEPTPGGQVVSLVDFRAPDLERFPRFAQALAAGQVAQMEPGDVLVYPAMWWHHVEALAPFNVLINYWWNAVGPWIDTPQITLLHAMLALRERPMAEKAAWRALFEHYAFAPPELAREGVPEALWGHLAPTEPQVARRLRAEILRKLQR